MNRQTYSEPVSVPDRILSVKSHTSLPLEYSVLHYLKDKGAPIEGFCSPKWKEGVEVVQWRDYDSLLTWFKWR